MTNVQFEGCSRRNFGGVHIDKVQAPHLFLESKAMQSRAAAPIPLALPGIKRTSVYVRYFWLEEDISLDYSSSRYLFKSVCRSYHKSFGSNVAHVHCRSVEAVC